MERRSFLKLPLAAALAAIGRAAEPGASAPRGNSGIAIGPSKDRYDEELLIMGGRFDLKVSARDSGGDLCIYDTIRDSKGGPALHRHFAQDEWFYVIRGTFIVRVGEEVFTVQPGGSAFAPRRIPHAFAMISEGEGQMLVLFQPAGSMEDFFKQMAKIGRDIPQNQETTLKRLWADHGMEMLGPPLKF
jgi:mannose-6-phosphate isomerase-like protein (cupin superfamily)